MALRMALLVLLIGLLLSACSCHPSKLKESKEPTKDQLLRANQGMVARESERIEGYLKRRGLKAEATGSGLRMVTISDAKSAEAYVPKPEDVVRIEYSISLLDGSLCYASQPGKPVPFRVEHDVVESGLHEGIQRMKTGSEALLIMPPHLAHGLVGDEQKIPPMSTLVMQVKLIDVIEKKK